MPVERPCAWQPHCPRYAAVADAATGRLGSRCEEHQREHWKIQKAASRGTGTASTAGWSKARSQALQRDGHRCTRCGAEDRLSVHHLDDEAGGVTGRHDLDRLVTLCQDCHVKATAEQAAVRKVKADARRRRAPADVKLLS